MAEEDKTGIKTFEQQRNEREKSDKGEGQGALVEKQASKAVETKVAKEEEIPYIPIGLVTKENQ